MIDGDKICVVNLKPYQFVVLIELRKLVIQNIIMKEIHILRFFKREMWETT